MLISSVDILQLDAFSEQLQRSEVSKKENPNRPVSRLGSRQEFILHPLMHSLDSAEATTRC